MRIPGGLPESTVDYDRQLHGIHRLQRAEFIVDPRRYFAAIAPLGPLFHDQVGGVWVCSGYAESDAILRDHRRFSSARSHTAGARSIGAMLADQLLFTDPPRHDDLRGAVRAQFAASRIRERDQAMREMVDSVLRTLPSTGSLDLVDDFAAKLPSMLIASLLGMPGREADLSRWAEAYETLLGSLSTLPDIRDESVIPVLQEAMAEFRGEAERRAGQGRDDLIGSLVDGLGTEAPALDAIAANCVVLVGGGYQTLTHLVTTGLLLLDQHPAQQRLLRADPELVGGAIDEFMRLDGSSQYVARRATVDVELAGQHIRAGQTVLVLLAAANLDPRTFADPERLDIHRTGSRHLGFGSGRHYCIGAPYAERMARWAILGFLDRYPHYRPATGEGAQVWGHHPNTRCRAHARVVIDPPVAAVSDRPTASVEHQVTMQWNDTAAPLGPAALWHDVFAHRARLAPDDIAVDEAGRGYTYADVDRRANALARVLRGRGVQPESIVGVVMDRSVDFVISVLAVAKAGGAFLLSEIDCPAERLRTMVADAGVALLLTDSRGHAALHADLGTPILVVDTSGAAEEPPVTGATAGTTAYVVFTSGTTGRPKAIAVDHEGAVNLHVGHRRVMRAGPGDRVLQFLSPNFDGCVHDLLLSLLGGATLVVAPSVDLIVGPPLLRQLRDRRVTVVTLTPSVWAALPEDPLPDLRLGAAAGERLSAAVVARWLAPGRRFLNLYGPAEAAVWATWHECVVGEEPPIGRPIPNKRIYVLDEQLRAVPVGAEGEICIGGLGIGRYLGRPDLMEERFRPDPYAPDRRLYRTGDRGRWRQDGSVEYLGRRDRQVKIRGQRVELDEVERVLETAPGVSCCLVAERDGRLVALVVPVGVFDEAAVRAHLAARLHGGMVPAAFSIVDELPRSAAGKAAVDDRPIAVPQPDPRHPVLTRRVVEIFAGCLGVTADQIGRDSDFFTLGGDSLAIAGLLAGLEHASGSAFRDVAQLLACPTPAGIATHLLSVAGANGEGFMATERIPTEKWRELPDRIDPPEVESIAAADPIRVSHT
ncbi:amino acid adenylation domain-containing protein [Allocatelliglobosispora scoriae]|uniref:Amino acid adenylation domain-containing protein n=1 Tax=Allocatelliglobosispora scoriae TaxID=643052 RepID=A0A841BMN0_9ACTN|nr:amino acid adenylation domain-containing protein [Allocatelliglobosispora scoriae]MBB5868233.1 amino acid adenylation domain-containing protein [Allocatelliglobosispora scoriae]